MIKVCKYTTHLPFLLFVMLDYFAEIPVQGGTSHSSFIFVLLCVLVAIFFIVLYVKPSARERVFRALQGTRARLPVCLGGRSREDTTLLVSDGRMTTSGFGALSDEEDFS